MNPTNHEKQTNSDSGRCLDVALPDLVPQHLAGVHLLLQPASGAAQKVFTAHPPAVPSAAVIAGHSLQSFHLKPESQNALLYP